MPKIRPVRYHEPERVEFSLNYLKEHLENGQVIYVTFQSKTRCHVYAELRPKHGLGVEDITPHVARVCDWVQYDVSIRILHRTKDQIVNIIQSALADALDYNQNFIGVHLE